MMKLTTMNKIINLNKLCKVSNTKLLNKISKFKMSFCEEFIYFKDSDSIVSEIIELKKFSNLLDCTLKDLKMSCGKFDRDSELIGRKSHDKTSTLADRIIAIEKDKSLNHKIFQNLVKEIENYEIKCNEAESNILENKKKFAVKMKHCLRTETKYHKKVEEIEKRHQQDVQELSRWKLKCNEIDWKMRNEINPSVEKLNEKVAFTEQEIKIIEERIFNTRKRLIGENQMRESIKSLQIDFMDEFNEENSALLKLFEELISVTNDCWEEKEFQRKKLEEIQENFSIDDKLKVMRKEEVSYELQSTMINTRNRSDCYECIINELSKQLSMVREKLINYE